MDHADVIVIGGGAAGLMCALTAGQRGRRVIVLDASNKVGKKILMSGGGRCNFTNLHSDSSRFLGDNPHFCKSALSRYTQWDFIALVEKHRIAYHEKTMGQLFCDVSSKDIVAMLLAECDQAGVRIKTHSGDIIVSADNGYSVTCSHGTLSATSLVVATGGLSIPRMGASDFGYRLARQFGLQILNTRAGLVPFTTTGALHAMCQRLAGVSCRVTVTAGKQAFTEDMLFTHRGLSGPSMLQASSYWTPGDAVQINLLPGRDIAKDLQAAKTNRPRSLLRVVLAEFLPKALVTELQAVFWAGSSETPIGHYSDETLVSIGESLQSWSIKPASTEGYRTAEVTLGGVSSHELSSKTMECKKQSGLYFVGEVVDVTGHLGGHNFQWAWSSGYAAGQAV